MTATITDNSYFLYLAPIRGVTDALFRNVYHQHFPYFDAAVAPFINPQRNANFGERLMADVLPERNSGLTVIPQVLNNEPGEFLGLARRLQDLGYRHINWNLGCPAPMVANKQRGSGLLPHTDKIVALLQEVIPRLEAEVSLKTRLGYRDPADIDRLLPQLAELSIKEIIIHPRIGTQLYKGHADADGFARCTHLSNHTLVYNGDITSIDTFRKLAGRFPQVKRWMIGRGAIADPFLAAAIRGITFTDRQKTAKLLDFHTDLYSQIKDRLSGESHLMGRMKQIWAYFIDSFPTKKKSLKKITKASSARKYQAAVDEIFAER